MVSTQPIFSFKYFRFRKNKIPKGLKELFYLSWEDALWDILIKKNVVKGSKILVPDFYCKDVETNIRKHGYEIVYYKIQPNLKVDKKSFVSMVLKSKPSVVVIFHPVGIKSNLLGDTKWLIKTTGSSILIEDAVHRALDTKDFTIIKSNHFVMDSLRKVVPIQGCRVFGRAADLSFKTPSLLQAFKYSFKVNANFLLMNVCWTLGFNRVAENLMIKGYDLIGDSIMPAKGAMFSKILSDRLNVAKIQEQKEKQANFYMTNLKNITSIKLHITNNDKKHLRGYPVVLPVNKARKVLNFLRKCGLMIRFELNDSAWTKTRKIFYLPMGLQIDEKTQTRICNLIKEALGRYNM